MWTHPHPQLGICCSNRGGLGIVFLPPVVATAEDAVIRMATAGSANGQLLSTGVSFCVKNAEKAIKWKSSFSL